MNSLKRVCRTFLQMIKQVISLPHSVARAIKQRQQESVRAEREAERLDRIRNPSKYLGK